MCCSIKKERLLCAWKLPFKFPLCGTDLSSSLHCTFSNVDLWQLCRATSHCRRQSLKRWGVPLCLGTLGHFVGDRLLFPFYTWESRRLCSCRQDAYLPNSVSWIALEVEICYLTSAWKWKWLGDQTGSAGVTTDRAGKVHNRFHIRCATRLPKKGVCRTGLTRRFTAAPQVREFRSGLFPFQRQMSHPRQMSEIPYRPPRIELHDWGLSYNAQLCVHRYLFIESVKVWIVIFLMEGVIFSHQTLSGWELSSFVQSLSLLGLSQIRFQRSKSNSVLVNFVSK